MIIIYYIMCDYVYISIYISIPCDDYKDYIMCDYVYISIYILVYHVMIIIY